jgi:nicotinate-nucleotide pyrophosphorylase (carboxylating)
MPAAAIALPPAHIIDDLVLSALEEDGAHDDVTTHALVQPQQWGHGMFVAKDAGVISGLPVAAAAMTAFTDEISFDALVEDGERVSAGTELAEVEGPLAAILSTERVALNFLQRMSGVATLTRQFCDSVVGTRARILDTRKTTPGLRDLERYAVRCGGGANHRFNLSSGVLIKDNHIAAAAQRGITDVADVVLLARNSSPHTMRIEVEVTTMAQLMEALQGAADIILLDNMAPAQIREAVSTVAGRALVEASGGVTMETVREIAEAGVDFISIGALTHSAPALDISLEVASA